MIDDTLEVGFDPFDPPNTVLKRPCPKCSDGILGVEGINENIAIVSCDTCYVKRTFKRQRETREMIQPEFFSRNIQIITFAVKIAKTHRPPLLRHLHQKAVNKRAFPHKNNGPG